VLRNLRTRVRESTVTAILDKWMKVLPEGVAGVVIGGNTNSEPLK
jgi:hypothetical protein